MHVGVHEPGGENGAGHVDFLDGVAPAPADDHAVGERQGGVDPLARGVGEYAPAGDEDVGGRVAARHRERAGSRRGRAIGGTVPQSG